ncbi:MAG TPA: hypothetical protein VLR89_08345, partial [Anaerolineaceae bacterium]|nr:hypothetical protein [Anaerolineaceae bacterium]
MFDHEKDLIRKEFTRFTVEHKLENAPLNWRDLPFSGEWGLAIPFFPIAAADKNRVDPVPLHAQRLGEAFVSAVAHIPGISRVEAIKGYVNLYFSTAHLAKQVVETVRTQ